MSYKIELPDVDEMFKLVDKITDLSYRKSMLELEITFEESRIVKLASSDSSYYQGGKPPSVAFINSTWKNTGFNNELKPKREELAKVSADLESARLKFQLYKELVGLYRTQSANERSAVI